MGHPQRLIVFGLISYPQIPGLAEAGVHMIISYIRHKYIKVGSIVGRVEEYSVAL